jgi:hypothetical protein
LPPDQGGAFAGAALANDTQGEPMIEFVRVDVINPQPTQSKDEESA